LKFKTHVRIVGGLLLFVGLLGLVLGFLAGVTGCDPPSGRTLTQRTVGPVWMLSGLLAALAGRRNLRLENRPLGLVALAVLGALSFVYLPFDNPLIVFAAYGLVVYLHPRGAAVFRDRER
jgi:hypothetical protein